MPSLSTVENQAVSRPEARMSSSSVKRDRTIAGHRDTRGAAIGKFGNRIQAPRQAGADDTRNPPSRVPARLSAEDVSTRPVLTTDLRFAEAGPRVLSLRSRNATLARLIPTNAILAAAKTNLSDGTRRKRLRVESRGW